MTKTEAYVEICKMSIHMIKWKTITDGDTMRVNEMCVGTVKEYE